MTHLPAAKGRTLHYSERRALQNAGASAYRWFEESVYADQAQTSAINLTTARRINSALTAIGMTAVVAAIAYTSGPVLAVLSAIVVIAAAILPRPVWEWSTTGWVWPLLAAAAINAQPWALLTLVALIALPAAWWTTLSLIAIVTAVAVTSAGISAPFLPVCTLVAAAAIAARWKPVEPRQSMIRNLTATWHRPPIDTTTLHKPLPDRSLPWIILALNRNVRRTINEARKNLDDQANRLPDQWRAKIVGAVGERTTAMLLLGLPRNRWWQVHDIKVPGDTTANIDHVLIGPSGTWIVDAKQYRGTITLSDKGIRHNDEDLAPMLRTLAWEAGHLTHTLDTHVQALMLVPVAVCEHPISITVPASRQVPETTATILTSAHLADWLSAQPASTTARDRIRTLATLMLRTEGAYGPGTTPHVTVSRGISYLPQRGSLATREHTLTAKRPHYRRQG